MDVHRAIYTTTGDPKDHAESWFWVPSSIMVAYKDPLGMELTNLAVCCVEQG